MRARDVTGGRVGLDSGAPSRPLTVPIGHSTIIASGQSRPTRYRDARMISPNDAPVVYYSCAETAKLIRATLKAAFPAQKFSVRSSVYAGGASITVRWMDGPTCGAVKAVAGGFEGATFDGMQDLKSYVTHVVDGKRVRYASDYVFFERRLSVRGMQRVVAAVAAYYGAKQVPEVIESKWTKGEGVFADPNIGRQWVTPSMKGDHW